MSDYSFLLRELRKTVRSGSAWWWRWTRLCSITSGMSTVEEASTSEAGIYLSITNPTPHPCNHVSSYIITFQLLTGVWPLPPKMPNPIHVFPKTQRDALLCETGARGEKRSMHQHAVSCHGYKKGRRCFLLILPGKRAAIFSVLYMARGHEVNTPLDPQWGGGSRRTLHEC